MIEILRLNHRLERDKRVSTHIGLVSRAFGADKVIYTGDKDKSIEKSINGVVKRWGGDFKISYEENFEKVIKSFKQKKFLIIHLTMYGLKISDKIKEIRKNKNILIVIGGEKVPRSVYEYADLNISVTNQPHSEIAALAIVLDQYFNGHNHNFKKAEMKIKPSAKNKEFY